MSRIKTETETVIKKILPYLERRGYDPKKDLDFETAVTNKDRYSKGYIDILVTLGKSKPLFLIEAKKISKQLILKDFEQAINYARSLEINVPFVVVTNGVDMQCFNTKNKKRILWDGKIVDKIPTIDQLKLVIRTLKTNPDEFNISIAKDQSLPFRPGLPLRQLNALFYKCHSIIRKIEKNEENAFADFSKLLFLKLLEEKLDVEKDFELPYSYRFHELAAKPFNESDQVMDSILSMIESITKRTSYGEVLQERIKLKNPKTFHKIIKFLSAVSFYDCSLDSKGAAFEYFVRATLKGKKLGQYFTPRELIEMILALIGRKKIVNSVLTGDSIRVVDPACGTGGFLVFLMQDAIIQLKDMLEKREITLNNFETLVKRIKEDTFFGADANEGVAASAKMNMIIAGDGHTNIQHEDSLSASSKNWSANKPDCSFILTNPPFGTSETDSLNDKDLQQFDISSSKGQYLFLQKMVKSTIPGGEICTVIDEGVLNTESGKELRNYILKNCNIKAIVSLPDETFKPNKINVKSSLLYLEKRAQPDTEFEDRYYITFIKLKSLGYQGSGEKIRGFDKVKFLDEISKYALNKKKNRFENGYNWEAFDVNVEEVYLDPTFRLDLKYWEPNIRKLIRDLSQGKNNYLIKDVNTIKTSRGKSPSADSYVDERDGYALVIKAGSNISKFGEIIIKNSDWIEKALYDEFLEKSKKEKNNYNLVMKGDVLLSSTGDGTLGKCCVYDLDYPAIADGHVTVIRPRTELVDPYYLADYLRKGFGSIQILRLYTGSTGLIELTPDQVDNIVVDLKGGKLYQKNITEVLRQLEKEYILMIDKAEKLLAESNKVF